MTPKTGKSKKAKKKSPYGKDDNPALQKVAARITKPGKDCCAGSEDHCEFLGNPNI